MLGGYGHISSIDINSSRKFLQRFLRVGGTVCHAPKAPSFSQHTAGLFPLTCSVGSSVVCVLGELCPAMGPPYPSPRGCPFSPLWVPRGGIQPLMVVVPGWSQPDGDNPRSGLRGGHRPDHQAAAAAPLQDGGHGGRDGGLPHQGQELPGRGGQAGAQLLLLRPPGLQPRAQLLRCHLDPVGHR